MSTTNRPLGITILAILAGLGLLSNLSTALTYMSSNVLYAGWSLIMALLIGLAAFGMWTLKVWGWKVAVGVYSLNIISSLVVYVVLAPTIFADSVAGLGLSQSEYNAAYSIFSTMMMGSMVITIVIGLLIISYVYSKRALFVNP